MALNGIQIFKLTPKKNCKECGCPTCMAFAMKVAQGAMQIEQCPHMSEDALATLSEATAPPMKTIKIGTGDGEFTLGGETVLYRHEKTFVSKTRYAVSLCTGMSDAEVEAKLAEIPVVDYERIGERMHVELVYVNCGADADAAKYTALVEKAKGLGRTLILGCTDPEIAKAALEVCKDSKPVLNGANASNYEAMNAVATEAGVVLGVSGKDINELYDTTAALEKLGNKNLILDTTGADAKETFANTVLVRRAALKDQDRTFGYPSLVNLVKIAQGDKHLQQHCSTVYHEIRFHRCNGRDDIRRGASALRTASERIYRPAEADEGRAGYLPAERRGREFSRSYHCRLRSYLLRSIRRAGAFRCSA